LEQLQVLDLYEPAKSAGSKFTLEVSNSGGLGRVEEVLVDADAEQGAQGWFLFGGHVGFPG
jgi:hypothetical protein